MWRLSVWQVTDKGGLMVDDSYRVSSLSRSTASGYLSPLWWWTGCTLSSHRQCVRARDLRCLWRSHSIRTRLTLLHGMKPREWRGKGGTGWPGFLPFALRTINQSKLLSPPARMLPLSKRSLSLLNDRDLGSVLKLSVRCLPCVSQLLGDVSSRYFAFQLELIHLSSTCSC